MNFLLFEFQNIENSPKLREIQIVSNRLGGLWASKKNGILGFFEYSVNELQSSERTNDDLAEL